MAGIGSIYPDTAGAVTAPTPLLLSSPTAITFVGYETPRRCGLYSWMNYPGRPGVLFTSGLGPISHVLTAGALRTGLLAPDTAMAAAGTGVRATVVGTWTGQPANNDTFTIGVAGSQVTVTWKDTLVVDGTVGHQVKISAVDADTSWTNAQKFINGTGTQGTHYYNTWTSTGAIDSLATRIKVTSSAIDTTANTITLQYTDYGVVGNTAVSTESTANFTWASATFTGGTDGTGGVYPEGGARYFGYNYIRSEDGAESGLSPTFALTQAGNGNIALTAMADPDSADNIDFKAWYSSETGGQADRLFEGYRVATADTTDTDDLSDATLATHTQYDASYHRSFAMGMIPRLRYMVPYKGMWFAGGIYRAAEYGIGTCTVTHGSNAVVIVTGFPTKLMEGRTFARASGADAADTYTVAWVDETTRTVYLDKNFDRAAGAGSDAGATYTITDKRNAFALYRCEPEKPNQTTAQMVFTGVSSPDPAGITGLAFAFESVLIFTRTGLWRLTGTGTSPLTSRLSHEFEGVGCLSHHSIVYAGGSVYWMGADGFYSWAPGKSEPKCISNPQAKGLARGIDATFGRVNLLHAAGVFGHYDIDLGIIRWLAPLDGETTNRYALVYDATRDRWAGVWQYPDLTCITTVPGMDGSTHNLAGDVYGDLWELDVSNVDGYYGAEPMNPITAATTTTLTCGAATFSTTGDGLSGFPVLIVNVVTGVFTHAVVHSNTATVLTLAHVLTAAPVVGDVVMVGGIHARVASGRWHGGSPGIKKALGMVKTIFSPDVDGQGWLSAASEQDDVQVVSPLDFMQEDGEELCWAQVYGKNLKIQWDVIEPGFDLTLAGVVMKVDLPDYARV